MIGGHQRCDIGIDRQVVRLRSVERHVERKRRDQRLIKCVERPVISADAAQPTRRSGAASVASALPRP